MPTGINRWIVLYNKALFEKAGIEEPPTTWAELMDDAEKLKAAGITPFNATLQDGWRGFIWFEELLLRTDPEAYEGLNRARSSIQRPGGPARLRDLGRLYAKGYFTDPASQGGAARLRPRQGRDVPDRRLGHRPGRGRRPEAGQRLRRVHHAERRSRLRDRRHRRGRPDLVIVQGRGREARGGQWRSTTGT